MVGIEMSSFVNSGFKCFFLRQGEKREREEKRRASAVCEAASEAGCWRLFGWPLGIKAQSC